MPQPQKLSTPNSRKAKKLSGQDKAAAITPPSEAAVIRQLRKKLQKDLQKMPERYAPISRHVNLTLANVACLEAGIEEGILCLLSDIYSLLFRMEKTNVSRWIAVARETLVSEINANRATPKPL